MPHLSPMQWLITLMVMWSILLTMLSMNWWLQSPSFKTSSSTTSVKNKASWLWL